MPDISNVVAFNLLSDMPELGYLTNKEAVSLIGVAPFNKESGSYEGQRNVRGDRHKIKNRNIHGNDVNNAIPFSKSTYQRLVAAGNPNKTVIIACARKMVIILNSMVRDGAMWDPKMDTN